LPFLGPDQPWYQFFFGSLFSPCPSSSFFFFFSWLLKLFPSTHLLPPLSPTDLLTYISKLKVHSSPSTYSPINLKCATLILTHLPTPPSIYLPTRFSTFLPTNTLHRYLPNPTYMVTPTYPVAIPINPQWWTTMKKE
jgi:hypothetical protein